MDDIQHDILRNGTVSYTPGLDRMSEAVISSHFMAELSADRMLALYDEEQFQERARFIDWSTLCKGLLDVLRNSSEAFAMERATTARRRARENYRDYGLSNANAVGAAEAIVEAILDRQFSRNGTRNYSKLRLHQEVADIIAKKSPINMLIPALPFKMPSPLKSRGSSPDLGEVSFLLEIFEVARTVELLYGEVMLEAGSLATFTVVCDGSRFNRLVGVSDHVIEEYRSSIAGWIRRLDLQGYIKVRDYRTLLMEKLPSDVWQEKCALALRAYDDYGKALWPVFDPSQMMRSLALAAEIEPDPEGGNPEGRFVSLLKSLIFTINYQVLKTLRLTANQYQELYRELTAHIFVPYVKLSFGEVQSLWAKSERDADFEAKIELKECVRQFMLREVWEASILYMAEIKSDRELARDPVLMCLPGHLRWTIHAKRGQLAIASPVTLGKVVQPWAGTAVFKRTKKGKIRLASLPLLALEGAGATPVLLTGADEQVEMGDQPLFYVYPDVEFSDILGFVSNVTRALTRMRVS